MPTSSSAIELAEAANAPLPSPARSTTSRGGTRASTCDGRTSSQQRNYETMRRYGHVGQTWWARAQLAGTAYELGRWDEALEHAEAVLAYVEAGTPHYFESGCRLSRAAITFARGDDSTFAEDIDRSLELAAKATDPQATAPVVAAVACLRAWSGDLRGARELLDSALETARTREFGFEIIEYDVALVAALLDLDREQLGVPPVAVLDTPRRRAAAALYDHDLLGAADALAELGSASHEAYLRLRAGERLLGEGRVDEGVEQLERALAFYRGVRATRFIAEAESLLAGIEQQTAWSGSYVVRRIRSAEPGLPGTCAVTTQPS